MNSFDLATVFCDSMVLQRNKQIKIWGKSAENNLISVIIEDASVVAKTENGRWEAILPPMEACERCEIHVHSNHPNDTEVIIRNVAIGEVWIAGGQSNMEFELQYDAEATEVIPTANNPHIRYYDCPKISYEGQEAVDAFSEYGFWRVCNANNAPYYSAVAYYFAQQIYDSQKVPVGIIGCNWGGTAGAAWLKENYMADSKELIVYLKEYEEAVKFLDISQYEKELTQFQEDAAKMNGLALNEPVGPKYFNRPSGLYHGMVETIAGYAAKGVIWYQGESDRTKADLYDQLFSAIIKCWREAWQDELPFLFVQLAPFGSWLNCSGEYFPILRERQEFVSKTVEKAYMASVMDVGMEFDIHPIRKRPVGERLARLARNKVYGEDIVSETPETTCVYRNDNKIIIEFNHVGTGFILCGEKINDIQLFVDDKEIVRFESEAVNDRITLEMLESEITGEEFFADRKVEVRFAWKPYTEVNLFSSAMLPVKPFLIVLDQNEIIWNREMT